MAFNTYSPPFYITENRKFKASLFCASVFFCTFLPMIHCYQIQELDSRISTDQRSSLTSSLLSIVSQRIEAISEDVSSQNSPKFKGEGNSKQIFHLTHWRRMLLECAITDCVYCMKISDSQICIVCLFPKFPNTALDGCEILENNQTQISSTCSIQNCRACQQMSLGIINNQVCTQCTPGYRYLILQGQCFPIKELNDSIEIISYGDYYYLCQEGCHKCEPTTTIELCFTCRDGYSMIEGAFTCVKCGQQCKSCLSNQPEACLTCFPGFVLIGQTCQKCANEKCSSCLPDDPSSCSSCKQSYYMNQFNCKSCSNHCHNCPNATFCRTCEGGYFPTLSSSSSVCVKCLAGCNQCNSISSCSKCYPGFYLNQTSCNKCKENCLQCTSSQDCSMCLPGYDRFNGACIKQIPDCILMNNDGKCKVCKSYFEPTTDGKCLKTSGLFDTNLVTIACKYGMFTQNYWCYHCPQTFPNCIECNFRYCLKCKDGFFLRNSDYTCQPTSLQGCKVSHTQHYCVQCSDGYFMVEEDSDGYIAYGQCKVCDKNCKTCIMQSHLCLDCHENYTLNTDRSCEGAKKLKFTISLNTELSNIPIKIAQIKLTILNAIATNESKSQLSTIERVKLTKIYEGSVFLEGYVDFETQQTLQKGLLNISQILKKGSSLAGFDVIDAAFSGQDPVPPPEEPSKVAMILAIVIPCGTIILIALIFVIVKYRQLTSQDEKKSDSANEQTIQNPNNQNASNIQKNQNDIFFPVTDSSLQKKKQLPTIFEEQSKVQVDMEPADPHSHKAINNQYGYQYL